MYILQVVRRAVSCRPAASSRLDCLQDDPVHQLLAQARLLSVRDLVEHDWLLLGVLGSRGV